MQAPATRERAASFMTPSASRTLPRNDRRTMVVPAARFTRLRRYNLLTGVLRAAQAVAVLALATSFAIPVRAPRS